MRVIIQSSNLEHTAFISWIFIILIKYTNIIRQLIRSYRYTICQFSLCLKWLLIPPLIFSRWPPSSQNAPPLWTSSHVSSSLWTVRGCRLIPLCARPALNGSSCNWEFIPSPPAPWWDWPCCRINSILWSGPWWRLPAAKRTYSFRVTQPPTLLACCSFALPDLPVLTPRLWRISAAQSV